MDENQIIKAIALNPLLVYQMAFPVGQKFNICRYERDALPGVFGNLLGIQVSSNVTPLYRFGNVFSFDIAPTRREDPAIVYSPIALHALIPYYKAWSDIMVSGNGFFGKRARNYDKAISYFVVHSTQLCMEEVYFAVVEMLKFKNTVVLNNV